VVVMLTALARWLVLQRRAVWAALGATLLVIYTGGSAAALIDNYTDWQLRAVKDQSLVSLDSKR